MQRGVCTVTRAAPQPPHLLLDGFTGRDTHNGHPREHLQPLPVGRGSSPSEDLQIRTWERFLGLWEDFIQALLFFTHFVLFVCFICLLLSPRLDTLAR